MERGLLTRVLRRYLNLRETWVIFFVLGIIMMNYPFIQIFNSLGPFLGLPALFIYLFIGWLLSICVIFLFIKAIGIKDGDKGEDR
ncbi:MAG TPA: hypothetical protein VMJ66_01910 [Geobacteraceae bacterium]|nr:hypothetical protein [Geobacteraceae bacterium]